MRVLNVYIYSLLYVYVSPGLAMGWFSKEGKDVVQARKRRNNEQRGEYIYVYVYVYVKGG